MHQGSRICVLLPLLALILLVGCSRGPEGAAPTSPTATTAGAPMLLAAPAGEAKSAAGFATKRITAAVGGVVEFGRFKVTIPPGALATDTDITVKDPGGPYVNCELGPHGTQFLFPVTLEVDLQGLGYLPWTDWTVYWHAGPDLWVDQGGVLDWRRGKVRARLQHFSEYDPGRGRAGW
jgi:hypothetical protein